MAFLAWFILLACVRDPTPSDKHAAATVAGLPVSRFPIFPAFPISRLSLAGWSPLLHLAVCLWHAFKFSVNGF